MCDIIPGELNPAHSSRKAVKYCDIESSNYKGQKFENCACCSEHSPVMMLARDAEMEKETWKYFAMKVTKPVLIDCSQTTASEMLSHMRFFNNFHI